MAFCLPTVTPHFTRNPKKSRNPRRADIPILVQLALVIELHDLSSSIFCWNSTLPFISLPFFQKTENWKGKRTWEKVTWPHRKWQSEHYGMLFFFFFLENGKIQAKHQVSTILWLPLLCQHPSTAAAPPHKHTGSVCIPTNPLCEDVVETFWLDLGPLLTTVYEADKLQSHKFEPKVKCKEDFLFLALVSWREQNVLKATSRQEGSN